MAMVKPYKRIFYFTTVLTIILAPLAVLRPKMVEKMVDNYIIGGDVRGLTLMACTIAGILIIEVILRYFFLYWQRK